MTEADFAKFSGYRAWAAEGARVAIISCLTCGAAVFIDGDDEEGASTAELHLRWHERITT